MLTGLYFDIIIYCSLLFSLPPPNIPWFQLKEEAVLKPCCHQQGKRIKVWLEWDDY